MCFYTLSSDSLLKNLDLTHSTKFRHEVCEKCGLLPFWDSVLSKIRFFAFSSGIIGILTKEQMSRNFKIDQEASHVYEGAYEWTGNEGRIEPDTL